MVTIELDGKYAPKHRTWQDLDGDVCAHGGVLRVLMRDLRRLSGYQRLKIHVVGVISGQLRNMGLDYLPRSLPRDQNQYVVVFKIGSEADAVVNAVRKETSSEEAESALRKLNMLDSIKAGELENLLEGFRDILSA